VDSDPLQTPGFDRSTITDVNKNVEVCLGGAAVRTRDRKAAGSTLGRGATFATRSTQPTIPPCAAGVTAGTNSESFKAPR